MVFSFRHSAVPPNTANNQISGGRQFRWNTVHPFSCGRLHVLVRLTFPWAGHGCVYRGYLPVLLPHVCGCFHRDVGSRWRRPALNKKPGENKHAAEGCLSLSNTALTCFFLLHRPLLSWQLRQLKCRWSKANGEQMQQQGAITSRRWRVSPLNQLFNHSITNIKVFPQNIYSNVM